MSKKKHAREKNVIKNIFVANKRETGLANKQSTAEPWKPIRISFIPKKV